LQQSPTPSPRSDGLVLTGGRVLGPDGWAGAVGVRGGVVTAIGDAEGVRAATGPDARVVDVSGRWVIPGLADGHCHFEDAAMDAHAVPLRDARTVADALDRIAAFAAGRPDGEWIRGQTWNPVLQLAQQRPPTRTELDAAAAGRPVLLHEGHGGTASSAALRRAGIDPAGHGGHLDRADADRVAAVVPPWTPAQRRAQIRDAMRLLNAHGITSVVAGAMTPADLAVVRALADDGGATVRVAAMVVPTGAALNPDVDRDRWRELLAGGPPGPTPWTSVRGVKLQIDGGMTLGTAHTRDDYPGRSGYRGSTVVDAARLRTLVRIAHDCGWPVGVHVVGDAAVDLALDVLGGGAPGRLPDVLIHASLMTRDQMLRARGSGVVVAAQAPFLWRNGRAIAGHLGEDALRRAVPFRDWLDVLGPDRVCAGTDHPINALDPFPNMYLMRTRRDVTGADVGAGQRITAAEALGLYTASVAAHTGRPDRGRITVGADADLTVVDRDPLDDDPAALLGTSVELTVVAGRMVHERTPAATA